MQVEIQNFHRKTYTFKGLQYTFLEVNLPKLFVYKEYQKVSDVSGRNGRDMCKPYLGSQQPSKGQSVQDAHGANE
jgi:hypothetical protein